MRACRSWTWPSYLGEAWTASSPPRPGPETRSAMHIVVRDRQVPDPDIPPSHFKVDEAAKRVIPPAQGSVVMNGYDANALEAALQIKEKHGGSVTVVSLGAPEVKDALKRALAMGADQAVQLTDPAYEQLDATGVAKALAAAIRKLE